MLELDATRRRAEPLEGERRQQLEHGFVVGGLGRELHHGEHGVAADVGVVGVGEVDDGLQQPRRAQQRRTQLLALARVAHALDRQAHDSRVGGRGELE